MSTLFLTMVISPIIGFGLGFGLAHLLRFIQNTRLRKRHNK